MSQWHGGAEGDGSPAGVLDPLVPTLLATGGLLLLLLAPGPLLAQDRRSPPPPASKPTIYDPDPLTCQPATIRSAFARQLEPFHDQGPAVLARLRAVQLEMARSSLQRCVTRGLMDNDTATALWAELQRPQVSGSNRP